MCNKGVWRALALAYFQGIVCCLLTASITWFVDLCSPHTRAAGGQWSTSLPPSPWLLHPSVQIHRDGSLWKARGLSASLWLGISYTIRDEFQCHWAETPDTSQWIWVILPAEIWKTKPNQQSQQQRNKMNILFTAYVLLLETWISLMNCYYMLGTGLHFYMEFSQQSWDVSVIIVIIHGWEDWGIERSLARIAQQVSGCSGFYPTVNHLHLSVMASLIL
jgi:hypothetical protein